MTVMQTSPQAHATVTLLAPLPRRAVEQRAEFQGTLALDLAGAQSPPPPPETPELSARSARSAQADAELRGWVARLAQALVETATGHRPVSQLVRWTTPAVHRELAMRHRVMSNVPAPPSRRIRPAVRSIHLCRVRADALEASVHVRHGERSRAVAMRLEQHADRWICVAVEFA